MSDMQNEIDASGQALKDFLDEKTRKYILKVCCSRCYNAKSHRRKCKCKCRGDHYGHSEEDELTRSLRD